MNAFVRYGLEPEPLPDLEAVKRRYLEEAARLHPDTKSDPVEKAAAEKKLAEWNIDFETLSSGKNRLALLVEIFSGRVPSRTGRISGEGADRLMKLGALCQKVDRLLQRKRPDLGVIEAALFSGEVAAAVEEVAAAQGEMGGWMEELDGLLRELQGEWKAGERSVEKVENLYQQISFCEKGRRQLEERFLKLADCL